MTLLSGALFAAWIGAVLAPPAGWLVWRRLRLRRRRSPVVLFTATLAAFFYGLGVWGFLIEPQMLVVRHVSVAMAALRGPPLRIGVISDIHVGVHMSPARVRRTMARFSAERPDLIVFLGDYAGDEAPEAARSPRDRAAIMQGVDALASVRPPLGSFAVLGNHDWWYGGPAIEARARRAGLPVLANNALRIDRSGGAFWVAGVEDVLSTRAAPSVPEALRGIPAGEPVILLTHWPDVFFEVPARVALTLAAHNHCGQVNLPVVGRLIAASPGSRRWPCGLYDEGGRNISVTGGLGVSLLPVRFRTPPEIVIVTLSAAP